MIDFLLGFERIKEVTGWDDATIAIKMCITPVDIIKQGEVTERELENLVFVLGVPVSLLMVVGESSDDLPIPTLRGIILDRIKLNLERTKQRKRVS